MMKVVQYGLGIGLILIGIAGLFLPLIQGVLLIVAGFLVLRAHNIPKATRHLKHHYHHVKSHVKGKKSIQQA